MINPIKIIKEEHRMVEKLFLDYQKLGDTTPQRKKEVANQICNALTLHIEMEETCLYPKLKEKFEKEEEKIVEEAYAEHEVAKDLIADILSLEPEDVQFDAKIKVLEEVISHHVEEEEEDLLPKPKRNSRRKNLQIWVMQ